MKLHCFVDSLHSGKLFAQQPHRDRFALHITSPTEHGANVYVFADECPYQVGEEFDLVIDLQSAPEPTF